MSSPERELLKRHCNWKLSVEEHLKLLRETEALLTQPEQIEQEPVAWMCNLLGNVVTYKPNVNNGYTPLYASPQKREQELMGDGDTADGFRANKMATHADSYWAGVNDAEKYHGITGETK
jgi:hypothetical protein